MGARGGLRPRRAATGVVTLSLALAVLGMGATQASAATTTVTCSSGDPAGTSSPGGYTLQQVLTSHVAAGDTVIIDGLCTGAFELPTETGGYTIEGQPGVTSGFDGENASHGNSLVYGTVDNSSASVATTLENLTFENALGTSSDNYDPTLDLTVQSGAVTLSGDTFENSVADHFESPEYIQVVGNGANCTSEANSLTIANSVFTGNTYNPPTSTGVGGAGLTVADDCQLSPVSFVGDHFTDNTFAATAASTTGLGGGLFIGSSNTTAAHVVQRNNVFDANHVTTTVADDNFGGGGEWLQGVDLESTGDQFTNNTLPGTTDAWSWGAGLGVLNSACASSGATTGSTLSDDVVAANTIGDTGSDVPSDAQGAGIYIGAFCGSSASHNNLTIEDSTVTGNAVTPASSTGSPVAGIDGGTYDTLTLDNSILYGDTGGAETGGFSATGSSLTATYSDLCNSSSPYPGSGNICAAPGLGGTLGVQETASSPTIDKGSAALVPSGLTTDFFGNAREANGTAGCASLAGTVDIGAAEYTLTCPPLAVATPAPTITNATETHGKWTDGSAQATISRKHKHHKPKIPVGTSFNFTLNEQAAVTLTFTKSTAGREVHGTCVAQTKKNRKHHSSCALTQAAGTLTFTGPAGADSVAFDGLLQDGAKLGPGSYTVAIGASAAGETATPATLSFTIAKS